MAIDSDNPVSLPNPPPPRPAARREAIDAALRKFDGIEDAERKEPARSWWASNRRQFGALATAAVIAVVSVPVAVIVLQDQPKPATHVRSPVTVQPRQSPPVAADTAPAETAAAEEAVTEVPRSKLPLEPHGEAAPLPGVEERKATSEAPAMVGFAAAPPAPSAPPPPPPPPAPAPERDEAANMETGSEIITTGSRIAAPAPPSTQHGRLAAKRAADAVAPVATVDVYGKFLPRLQSAIRSNNRRAVTALIQFPLRVNTSEGSRTYPDRKAVEDDFDRIFTARVRKAILDQRPDQLFVRDQGAMVGDGEIWFDQTCRNADCSQVGPVRIKAVNP